MLIQVIRGGLTVLLHDPSGISMPGYCLVPIEGKRSTLISHVP